MAKLHFHYSTMNAGKSTSLIQSAHNYMERGMTPLVMSPSIDSRSGVGRVASRIGIDFPARPFQEDSNLIDILKAEIDLLRAKGSSSSDRPICCVFIDEAQFMTPSQVDQAAMIADVLDTPVMAYGLRTDFQGRFFPGSKRLMEVADRLVEIRTICFCARKATMVLRLDAKGRPIFEGPQVHVGGNETYVSVCRKHWFLAKAAIKSGGKLRVDEVGFHFPPENEGSGHLSRRSVSGNPEQKVGPRNEKKSVAM